MKTIDFTVLNRRIIFVNSQVDESGFRIKDEELLNVFFDRMTKRIKEF